MFSQTLLIFMHSCNVSQTVSCTVVMCLRQFHAVLSILLSWIHQSVFVQWHISAHLWRYKCFWAVFMNTTVVTDPQHSAHSYGVTEHQSVFWHCYIATNTVEECFGKCLCKVIFALLHTPLKVHAWFWWLSPIHQPMFMHSSGISGNWAMFMNKYFNKYSCSLLQWMFVYSFVVSGAIFTHSSCVTHNFRQSMFMNSSVFSDDTKQTYLLCSQVWGSCEPRGD